MGATRPVTSGRVETVDRTKQSSSSSSSSSDALPPAIQHFMCGWGAAVVETTIVYPLNKLTFRQQLHGIQIHRAFKEIGSEGIRYLYRGLLPPLIQKTTTRSLMFGMYEEFQRKLDCRSQNCRFGRYHALAAFLAGSTEAVLCPLERVQVLLQSPQYHGELKNTHHAFAVLFREYGMKEFYRGLTPIIARNGPSNILFFFLRDPIKDVFVSSSTISGEWRTVLANFASGAILGATLSTIFYPINVVKARMQSVLGGKFDSFFVVLRRIWIERNRSLKDFLLGGHLNYTRSLLSWGITNAAYELLRKEIIRES